MKKIAKLARIKVTDQETKSLEGELSSILSWVEQLNEVDTDDVEPLTSVVETTMKKTRRRCNGWWLRFKSDEKRTTF